MRGAAAKSLCDISSALGMFRSDPLISAVNVELHAEAKLRAVANRAVARSGGSDVLPSSTAELSKTFSRLMGHFQRECADAFKQSSVTATGTGSAAGDAPHPPSLGFFTDRVLPRIVDAAHLATTEEADLRQQLERIEQQRRDAVVSAWMLYGDDDVLAAIHYVTGTHRKVVESAAHGEVWARQPSVAAAMKNLLVWAVAAEQYLGEEQTARVLSNIARCTSHSFVQINKQFVSQQQQQQHQS